MMNWYVNSTSAAVNGAPSCQVTPRRRWMVYCRPSLEIPPFSTVGIVAARFGTNCRWGLMRDRASKRHMCTPRSTSMWGLSGLNTVGSCESPTMTCPPFCGAAAALPPRRACEAIAVPTPPRVANKNSRRFTDTPPLSAYGYGAGKMHPPGETLLRWVGEIPLPAWADAGEWVREAGAYRMGGRSRHGAFHAAGVRLKGKNRLATGPVAPHSWSASRPVTVVNLYPRALREGMIPRRASAVAGHSGRP